LSNAFTAAMIKYLSYEHAGIMLKHSAENMVSILGEAPVASSEVGRKRWKSAMHGI
jgi:hypothetical protein